MTRNSANPSQSEPQPEPQPVDREAIEARLRQLRAEIAELGVMLRAYGQDRLKGAQARTEHLPDEALVELQRQLSALEADLSQKVREKPMQSLGLAALAGLVVGLILRR